MRIVDIRECSIPVSRYADATIPSGGLTTSLVKVVTDAMREGRPVVGYGYASVGRFAQGGLIRERFAPRLLAAAKEAMIASDDGLDPFRAWNIMMAGEKPGGHGERCIAVGALDMAVWDAAAKIAGKPLYRFLAGHIGRDPAGMPSRIRVYAGGGYAYPKDDLSRLSDEMSRFRDLGFTHAKMKIGDNELSRDLQRIEVASAALGGPQYLAVDAMNSFVLEPALVAASALERLKLWWFEDVCDPLDFATQAQVAANYPLPIAAGEALFSLAEAKLLDAYGGLRRDRDILLFDAVHCYGLTGYLRIVDFLTGKGWPRQAFWPHGGHLFSLHVVAALGIGGAEVNPLAFHPFRGLADGAKVEAGYAELSQAPGIGFELNKDIMDAFRSRLA